LGGSLGLEFGFCFGLGEAFFLEQVVVPLTEAITSGSLSLIQSDDAIFVCAIHVLP